MKKRYYLILVSIIIAISGNYLLANEVVNKFSQEIEVMNAEQMKEIGVYIEPNSINFVGMRTALGKNKDIVVQYRQFEIKNNRINLKNAPKTEKLEQTALPIRLIVLKSKSKTAAYYNASILSGDKKKIDEKLTDIASNNWKAILYKTEKNEEIYLWYDAAQAKSPKIAQKNSNESNSNEPQNPEFITDIKIMPNPCRNSSAKIEFRTDKSQSINIEMYNIAGERVLAIANSQLFNSGSIELPINSEILADGMYLIVFTSEAGETISKRFIKVNG